MIQLLPEVKNVFDTFSDGIKRYEGEPLDKREWDELAKIIERVDEKAEKLKIRIIQKSPDFLKEILRDALYIKKNSDRTLLAYIGAILCDKDPDEFFDILFALDILDLSVLLIDDILDGAEKRANKTAHYKKWGEDKTLATALYLKDLSLHWVINYEAAEAIRLRILHQIANFHAKIYEGQFLDVSYHTKAINQVTVSDYLDMVSLTTGSQFAGSLKIGGILADADKKTTDVLGETGLRFGIIGQIRDDLIDYLLDEDYTWKTPLLDFKKNKKRIPLIIAWQNSDEEEKKEILCLQGKDNLGKEDYMRLISILMKPENLQEIQQIMKKIEHDALREIEKVSLNSEGLKLLRMLFNVVRGD